MILILFIPKNVSPEHILTYCLAVKQDHLLAAAYHVFQNGWAKT